MNPQIALFLAQDGLITGAVYSLLAVALVLVFTVTRVIFVPQGEFVAFAALTLAALQTGKMPGTVWLLLAMSAVALAMEAWSALQERDFARAGRAGLVYGLVPALLAGLVSFLAPRQMPLMGQALMTLALVVPLGPLLYRVAYQPVAQASILVLLIISVAVHLALTSLGLVLFGAEGSRTPPFSEARWQLWGMQVTGQSLIVLAASVLAIGALFWFFNQTFRGKALKATAVNRTGAQLMGISATSAGALAFTLSAAIGALSGLMIGPITTVFYDTGFLIGLKGFVAAIIGGLVSYPLAAAGAILVGMLESCSSFWASAYKEVIVFTLILPVLLWRSLRTHHVEEDDE
jgi:branched-chain amino acid transport system permease protein